MRHIIEISLGKIKRVQISKGKSYKDSKELVGIKLDDIAVWFDGGVVTLDYIIQTFFDQNGIYPNKFSNARKLAKYKKN